MDSKTENFVANEVAYCQKNGIQVLSIENSLIIKIELV
jgi:hypothetical protein